FRGPSTLETLEQVRTQEPVSPRILQPTLPRDLETICLKCLHKQPARRYGSARELAQELERFQKGEAVLARPVSRAEQLARWARRKPALAASLALALASALAALVSLAVAYVIVSQSRDDYVLLAEKESNARTEADRRRRQAEIGAAYLHFEQS